MAFLLMGYCGFTVGFIMAVVFGSIRYRSDQSLRFGIILRQIVAIVAIAVSMTGFYLSGTHLAVGVWLWLVYLLVYGATVFLWRFIGSNSVRFSYCKESLIAVLLLQIVDLALVLCGFFGMVLTQTTETYWIFIVFTVLQLAEIFDQSDKGGRFTYVIRLLVCALITVAAAFIHYNVLSFGNIYQKLGDLSAYDFHAIGVPLKEWTFVAAICATIVIVVLILRTLLNGSWQEYLKLSDNGFWSLIYEIICYVVKVAAIVFMGVCYILSGRLLAGAIVSSVVFVLMYVHMVVVCRRKDTGIFVLGIISEKAKDLPRVFHLLPVVASFAMMFLGYFFYGSNLALAVISTVCGVICLTAFIVYLVKGKSVTTKICLALPVLLCTASAILAFLTYFGVVSFTFPFLDKFLA